MNNRQIPIIEKKSWIHQKINENYKKKEKLKKKKINWIESVLNIKLESLWKHGNNFAITSFDNWKKNHIES